MKIAYPIETENIMEIITMGYFGFFFTLDNYYSLLSTVLAVYVILY
jgi:hypothetical protein